VTGPDNVMAIIRAVIRAEAPDLSEKQVRAIEAAIREGCGGRRVYVNKAPSDGSSKGATARDDGAGAILRTVKLG
jgi:hypothetical protein